MFNIILLLLGFLFLIYGADIFVDGASSTAYHFNVPKMLIALTIVAFGTSAPEFAVSMQSLAIGSSDMLLGNVIGSNVMNILLIIGIAAIIHPIKIKDNTIKKELPMCMLISSLIVVLFLDVKLENGLNNVITRSDAFVILLFFSIFMYYLIALAKNNKRDLDDSKPKYGLYLSLVFILLGLIGIVFGSNMVVENASIIAKRLGLSDRVIALTIIAFGTSLPELVTVIVSSKKGEQELLLGNIIGSNICNCCLVLGIPVAIYGTIVPSGFGSIDLAVFLISSVILFIFAQTKRTITKDEGWLMVMMFLIYYILVFVL